MVSVRNDARPAPGPDRSSTEGSERKEVSIFVHGRILRPILGLNLLFMSLPLVLGGYGRNTFINLGFAWGTRRCFTGRSSFASISARSRYFAGAGGLGAADGVWGDRHLAMGPHSNLTRSERRYRVCSRVAIERGDHSRHVPEQPQAEDYADRKNRISERHPAGQDKSEDATNRPAITIPTARLLLARVSCRTRRSKP